MWPFERLSNRRRRSKKKGRVMARSKNTVAVVQHPPVVNRRSFQPAAFQNAPALEPRGTDGKKAELQFTQ
ncbi:MAG: hypothetical protein DLM53_06790 [Candidatus Eremiobacter antarcticus]|nr:MAG: hypothetical protein DLM53_06790 [Candidatus Eremiobacter sp. RRmetagenome_bin22]